MTVRNIVSAAASIVDVATSDPQFQNTTLLLSGDGTNGAQNNTFLDNSIPGGYGVYYAQGGASWLTTSTSLSLTSDFTIEFWIKLDAAAVSANTYQGILSIGDENAAGSTGLAIYGYSGGAASLYVGNNASAAQNTAKGSLGIWTHVAVVRSGSTVKIALNGDMTGAGVVTGWSATISGAVTIGGEFYNGSVGWALRSAALSNVRIVNGTALYTTNFTPPVAPLTAISGTQLLVCQSSALFVDNSPLQATNTSSNLGGLSVISPSNYGMTITRTGSTTQGSFSPYGDLWSNYFNGSNQYITAPAGTAFNLGSGNFTAECWVYLTSFASSIRVFGQTDSSGTSGSTSILMDVSSGVVTGYLGYSSTPNSFISCTGSATITTNAWHHLAMVRNGSEFRVYVNGAQGASSNVSGLTVSSSAEPFTIGRNGSFNGLYLPGYVSNMRLVKGTALYTSAFTPSTTPLTAVSGTSLLTCQSNRFRDNSSNNFAITVTGTPSVQRFSPFDPAAEYSTSVIGASAYFDGSSSLSVPANAALTMGTSDFTVEFWMYATNAADLGTAATIVRIRANAATTLNLQLNSGQMYCYTGGNGPSDPTQIQLNTWIHYAAVCNSGIVTLYRNGVSVSSGVSINLTASDTLLIGVGGDSSDTAYPFYGYIADLRIVKGTALYTANFTPSTAPLKPTINTSLLLNYANAGIVDNTMMNDLVTVGNAQVSTSVKKYGTGSMYFDGTGDYLSYVGGQNSDFGTGNFTVEFWMYATSITSQMNILATGGGFGTGASRIGKDGSFGMALYTRTGVDNVIVSEGNNTFINGATNQWVHYAIVRNGNTFTLFRNGTSISTGTFTGSISFFLNGSTVIGTDWANDYFPGYIDDLRITKGIARYTANFTPPTSALPKR